MSSMSDKTFLDTNVLVYGSDDGSPEKKDLARATIHKHGGFGVLSTQVLQEYYVAATRKLAVTPHDAKQVIATARVHNPFA